jgi:hypothetical protein
MKIFDSSIRIATKLNVYADKTHRHFAFIYVRNKLLSIGQNDMETTSAKAYRFGRRFGAEKTITFPFLHAEIDAIAKLWGNTHIGPKMSLVSLRLNKKNELMISKPCKSCTNILEPLGIRVFYFDGENINEA